MTLTFDQNIYRNLLAEVAPVAIETEEEYERALLVAEQLTFKKNRTPEERALLKLLVILIESYEAQNYPMDESTPQAHPLNGYRRVAIALLLYGNVAVLN